MQGYAKGLRGLVQDKARHMPQTQLPATCGGVDMIAPHREPVGRRKGLQAARLGQRLHDRGIAL